MTQEIGAKAHIARSLTRRRVHLYGGAAAGARDLRQENVRTIRTHVSVEGDNGALLNSASIWRNYSWVLFSKVFNNIFKVQKSTQITRELFVTATHGHLQSQRNHQCVAGFLGGNRMSDGKSNGLMVGALGRSYIHSTLWSVVHPAWHIHPSRYSGVHSLKYNSQNFSVDENRMPIGDTLTSIVEPL
ncbi:hypothetical protein EVAR_69981_1 [Eumeta japonica]|uniref:Uncharacterized protein n=1 Tax=Eumeta variegata TaxID=151549 RepID=A0A4C1ZDA1_EUMVA|nr:hypothetical protein EVAR_69981_1 [Eumeta japonica]